MLTATSTTYGHTAHIHARDRMWIVSVTAPGQVKRGDGIRAASTRVRAPLIRPIERLTEREWQVLESLVAGASNREIAEALRISNRTVESHLGNIYGKLGVRGRAEAMLWGIDMGLPRQNAPHGSTAGRQGRTVA